MKLFVLLVASVISTGCIPIVMHGAMQAEAKDRAAYSTYITDMERLNTERELAGLASRPVLTQREWSGKSTNRPPALSPKSQP